MKPLRRSALAVSLAVALCVPAATATAAATVPAAAAAAASPSPAAPVEGATTLLTGELVQVADAHSTADDRTGDHAEHEHLAFLDVDGVALDLAPALVESLADVASGSRLTVEVPVPAEVVAAVTGGDPVALAPVDGAPQGEALIPVTALAAATTVAAAASSDLAAATVVAEADAAAPLEAEVVRVSPVVAAASSAQAHTVSVAVVGLAGKTDARYTDTEVTRLLTEASDFWEDQSGGDLSFAQAGPTVRYSSAVACSNYNALWNEGRTKTGFTGGANNHLLLLLPAGTAGCSYGLGSVGSSSSSGGLLYVADTSWTALAHELGHNMSLNHANELNCSTPASDVDQAADGSVAPCAEQAYGDRFDIMASSASASSNLGVVGLTRLGLLETAEKQAVTASGVTTVQLAALSATSGVRAATVVDPRNGDTYYLENRQSSGRDTWGFGGAQTASPSYPSGTTYGLRIVKRGRDGTSVLLDPTPNKPTVFDANTALAVGQTFVSVGGGLEIRSAAAVDGTIAAQVSVAALGQRHWGGVSTATTVTTGTATGATSTSAPTLPVTVSVPSTPAVVAAGTVTVTEGSTTLGTATLVKGRASVKLPKLTVGEHTLTTTFTPTASSTLARSTATSTLTVTKVASKTTAVLSAKSLTVAQAGSITVTTAAAGVVPAGAVSILDGSTEIATGTLVKGRAVIALPLLDAGSHTLTATWGGDSLAAASTSAAAALTVIPVPTAVVAAPSVKATSTTPATLAVTGRAGAVALSGAVTVSKGSTQLATGTMAGGRLSVKLPLLAVGTHTLTVALADSTAADGASVTTTVVVARGTPVLTVTSRPTALAGSATGSVGVKLTSPAGVPTGEVRLVRAGVVLATANLSSGTATLTVPGTLAAGKNALSVVYVGDDSHLTRTSAAFTVTKTA